MRKPKVTVGVCVRNGAVTLREAIESIISQDYPHDLLEIVFIDDGSRDGTLSIINSYIKKTDIYLKIFSHKWKGLGFSRNVVVNNASGEYIVWVDADMILPKDHIKKQVEFMEKNHKIGIAKARYGILDEENLISFLENISYVTADVIYGGKSTTRVLGTGGSIYRTKAIRHLGGFDNYICGVGEDIDAEFRINKAGWLLYLGSPAVFYEQRRKSPKAIWDEGFWHGYGGKRILQKNRKVFELYKMTPLGGLIAGFMYVPIAFKITRRKIVFLLPLQYFFKRIAWCFGFIKGQINECESVRINFQ